MPRPKKEYQAVSLKLDKEIFERLDAFCNVSGQPKTTAIERALVMYIDANAEKYPELMESASEETSV